MFDVFDLLAKLKLDSSDYESGLNRVGSAISSGLGKVVHLTEVALAGATAAVSAFVKQSVSVGSNFDQAMGSVAATLGQTVEELEGSTGEVETSFGTFEGTLREFAMFMGQNTKFSASEAAAALNYMALAGYDTQESMQMLPTVLDMAAAGSMDLAKASDMVTDTQMAMGLTFERTAQMADEFAKAASSGNTSVEQLGEAFLRVGGLARELNGGIVELADGTQIETDATQQLEVAFTAMANAGIKGAEAGTHMRNIILKLANPTKEGESWMSRLGISVFDAEGNMRSLTDVVNNLNTVMNKSGADGLRAYYNMLVEDAEASGDVDKYIKSLKDDAKVMGSLNFTKWVDGKETLLTMEEFEAALERVTTSAGGLSQEMKLAAIGDLFNTRDTASMEALLGAVQGQMVRIGEETYSLDSAYEKFGDAIYDSSQGFEIIESSWNDLAAKITDAEGAAAQMSETKLDNLNGSITLFKSALETAQITLNDQLSPTLKQFVDFGTKGVAELTTAFKEGGFEGAMGKFGELLSEGLNMVIGKLPDFIKAGGKLLSALGKGLMDNLPVVANAAVAILGEIANTTIKAIPALIEVIATITETLLTYISDNMPQMLTTVGEVVMTIANSLLEHAPTILALVGEIIGQISTYLIENLPTILAVFVGLQTSIWQTIMDSLPTILATVLDIIMAVIGAINENLGVFLQAAADIILTIIGGLMDALPMLLEKLPDILYAIVDTIIDNLPILLLATVEIMMAIVHGLLENLPALVECIVGLVGAIGDAIIDNLPVILNAGVDLVFALINGIIDNAPELLVAAVKLIIDFGKAIIGAFPKIIDIGAKLIAALIEGIVNVLSRLLEMGAHLIGAIIEGIVGMFKELWNVGKDIVDAVKNGFKEKIDAAKEWGKDLMNNFVGGIKDKWNNLKEGVKGVASSVKDFLGFSEPKKGPLSNFHTYAPDMMKLFAKGIADNEGLVTHQIEKSFAFGDSISVPMADIQPVTRRGADVKDGDMTDALVEAIKTALSQFEIDWNGKNLGRLIQKYA